MTGKDFGVIWECAQNHVQGVFHFFTGALEELAAPADEQSVSSEDHTLIAGLVLHKVADTVLSVAWRVQSGDVDVFANLELALVGRCLGYSFTIFAAYDGDGRRERLEDLGVAPGVIPVMMCVDDGCEVQGLCYG